ncbi:alpha-amylase family protein [Algoriphagus sp. NG3]|uniref:alpha-amylase family protein n=1 Tax=Algoriphagus sp. NG3 TaxID=3097546 RepID=UPI002A839867|nr:alpha-amylase family protein [Algoriphagus sp. NG3]WPR76121.1 alpha-amylase family protein [Algoriphagus sp. NG3]
MKRISYFSMRPVCKDLIYGLIFMLLPLGSLAQSSSWPDSIPWWKANNLRVIQTNLPAYEAETLNADSLIADLKSLSANTLIINAGGIMAFYPTQLEYQYTNPYMKENMLGDVITKCHENGIKVIVRFDFSRAHKSIFDKQPDWFYLSPEGKRIVNDDMYVISINAPYEQEQLFNIIEEVIDGYPIDGIFINMPGYATKNAYTGEYHGIDQNPYDMKRFSEYSNGMKLPVTEDYSDPVFTKYQEFKQYTSEDLMRRVHELVKSKNEQIAICTYSEKYVDIIRHESQTNSLPYWPYNASDNVNNTIHSYPDHIVSNASIQQISFQSRYNAVEPEEVAIRLYENIANGSGLDMSIMGDFRDYEDERNFDIYRKVYALHKKYEPYFGNYTSPAKVAVIAPGSWPSGDAAHEYRGIQLMLKESHIQFDIVEKSQIAHLEEKLKTYKLLILPEITNLDAESLEALIRINESGTNLIATNRSLSAHPEALESLFGAKIKQLDHEGSGYYLNPADKKLFTRFEHQKLLFWKFNLGLYDFEAADEEKLPIYTPGRPGPPEKIGGHETSGYHAVGIKKHAKSNAVLLPINLGKLYYLHGYEQHKNILLDLIDYSYPEVNDLIVTDVHPRIEAVLQEYARNIPENHTSETLEGMILHLVNLTGFSGNTYFSPLPIQESRFKVKTKFEPRRIWSMIDGNDIIFDYEDGYVTFVVKELGDYEGIVIER